MRLRLVALPLICLVAAAPSLLLTCEIMCAGAEASRAADEAMPVEHACHHAHTTAVPAIAASIHPCGHDEGLPVTSAGEKLSPAVTIAVVVAVLPDPIQFAGPGSGARSNTAARPPGRSLRTQLRI